MGLDVDIIKTRAKGDFRLSKVRGECMISVRVPGGIMPAHLLSVAQNIAETWGNGVIHLTTRQKLAMPGIRYQDIDAVNKALEPFIKDISIDMCDVDVEDTKAGYQSIAGLNVVACQGSRICQKANTDATAVAQRAEKLIYGQPYHLKIVSVGCPNDCAKAHMTDVGIIGIAKMTFDASRCIGCGECVLACPTMAWQRDAKQLYMVKLGGRTSKKTPRVGKTFLKWVTEDVIQGVIKNILAFEEEMLKGEPVYLHMGHLIDRAGYMKFKERVLRGVELNPEAMVAERIYWAEDEYVADMHVKGTH
ncbi:4Fe-4S binding protein [Vibrio sp. S11_S32]|uniref:4Fe-4S binding protein n=1 Tax=Vibrio sp. S11_S32 TaxID=2720225 RepID=UPI001680618B|nr:4Fe-4S binding protein [Vibrio sp. S11_S32]MBD1576487.1 4Fe-4S binding protein [Vibrio sp. S11_S32]